AQCLCSRIPTGTRDRNRYSHVHNYTSWHCVCLSPCTHWRIGGWAGLCRCVGPPDVRARGSRWERMPVMASTTYVQGREVDDHPAVTAEAERGRVLRITEVGEDILHRPCREVTEFGSQELRDLVDDMFATMLVAEGVGLAANQVDVDLQLFVYDLTTDAGVRHVGHVCNPVVEVLGEETEEVEEGCLSVPGPGADLFRPRGVRLSGVDIDGEPVEHRAHGYLARCFQHETDHLGGRLYLDLLSKRTRKRVLKDMASMRADVLDRRAELTAGYSKEPVEYPAQPFL